MVNLVITRGARRSVAFPAYAYADATRTALFAAGGWTPHMMVRRSVWSTDALLDLTPLNGGIAWRITDTTTDLVLTISSAQSGALPVGTPLVFDIRIADGTRTHSSC